MLLSLIRLTVGLIRFYLQRNSLLEEKLVKIKVVPDYVDLFHKRPFLNDLTPSILLQIITVHHRMKMRPKQGKSRT